MPYSMEEGKREFIIPELLKLSADKPVKTVLDIGAGSGTYADILRPVFPGARFTGVEIFEPYIRQFRLHNRYETVIVGDIRELTLEQHDIVIMGDVLEHLDYMDALKVWDIARTLSNTAVVLSLPIIRMEQGCVYGNVHESHLHHWNHEEVLSDLRGIYSSYKGNSIGCYMAEPTSKVD